MMNRSHRKTNQGSKVYAQVLALCLLLCAWSPMRALADDLFVAFGDGVTRNANNDVTGHITGAVAQYPWSTSTYNPPPFFVADGSVGLINPHNIAFGFDGNLYADSRGDFTYATILKYDGATGAPLGTFLVSDFGKTFGKMVFSNGFMYVTMGGNPYQVDPLTGAYLRNYGNGFATVSSICSMPNGHILLLHSGNGSIIEELDPTTGDRSLFFQDAPDGNPVDITPGPNGTYYLQSSSHLYTVPATGGSKTLFNNYSTNYLSSLMYYQGDLFSTDVPDGLHGYVNRFNGVTGALISQTLTGDTNMGGFAIRTALQSSDSTPEPGSVVLLLGIGISGMGIALRQRRQSHVKKSL